MANPMVEESQWLAGLKRFQPEGGLAQFDGERIQVHPVDSTGEDLAQRMTEHSSLGDFAVGIQSRHFGRDAAGGGQ